MSNIKGMDKLIKKLQKFGKEAEQEIDVITRTTAETIAGQAKINAPVNKQGNKQGEYKITGGTLHQTNYVINPSKLTYSVVFPQKYAPYVEFGTGTKVDLSWLKQAEIPESYAAQFKGASQDRVHLPAQPFLFPAYVQQVPKYIQELKDYLKKLTN